MSRPPSPLERLYPKRCYDCLELTGDPDAVLCEKCKAVYERARQRQEP